jgi:hypothetical protein
VQGRDAARQASAVEPAATAAGRERHAMDGRVPSRHRGRAMLDQVRGETDRAASAMADAMKAGSGDLRRGHGPCACVVSARGHPSSSGSSGAQTFTPWPCALSTRTS